MDNQTNNWIELVDNFKWPITVIIGLIIFSKPIAKFIHRLNKVGIGNKSFEATQQSTTKDRKLSNVERAIQIFQPETIEYFNQFVISESEVNTIESKQEKLSQVKKYASILYLLGVFNSTYYSIYGSQLMLLQKLNTLEPATEDSLKIYYANAKKENPNVYEKYSYKEYLNYLYYNKLIIEGDAGIWITKLGVDFLKFLVETNKTIEKSY